MTTIRSMTGYGHAEGEGERYRVRVTLRSVNHRFLDLVLRLDEAQRGSETALRELLTATLARGRVEVGIALEPVEELESRFEVDRTALHRLAAQLDALVGEKLIARGLVAGDLLRHPRLLREIEPERRWEAEDEAVLLSVAAAALEELDGSRSTEGAKLAEALEERLAGLEAVVATLVDLAPAAREEAGTALRERVQTMLEDHPVDEARLAQEVAALAERSDVAEEVDRLGAHVAHFRELVVGGGAVGKRLDFLSQEILRELNTIGSKCRNAAMTRAVLDGKVLCEQLREQVQNVE